MASTSAKAPGPAGDGPVVEEVDTVVVGASVAGLATAACLRRAGVPFVVLEQAATVAAPWRGHYDRLHMNTSRGLSGLPHLAFPRRLPRYPARDQIVAYLEAYAARFDITPRFGQRVLSVTPHAEGWHTRVAGGPAYQSRHVVLATGHTQVPQQPRWPGGDTFGRPILHSSAYRNGSAFAGQRVLVVGMGNSGAEIALDLVEHGARPSVAVRSPINFVPRDFLGVPIVGWALLLGKLPAVVGDTIARLAGRIMFGRLDRLGLPPPAEGPVAQFRRTNKLPTIDSGALRRVRSGDIAILPDVQAMTPGHVHFRDGSRRPFDAVVLATGYRPDLAPLLGAAARQVLDADGHARDSGRALLPGLFACGHRLSLTGTFRSIGREARQIAAAIAAGSSRGAALDAAPRVPEPLQGADTVVGTS